MATTRTAPRFGESGDGIGLHHGHDQAVGDEKDDGEQAAQDRQPQSAGDVVGGATAKGAIRAAPLEQLSEGRLAEGGGGSQDRDEPHPQYGAWSAHDERQRDPDDVAGSHPAGQPDGEGLEGGDPAMAPVTGARHRDRDGPGVPQLNTAGPDREEDSGSHQQPHEDPGVEQVGGGRQGGVDLVRPRGAHHWRHGDQPRFATSSGSQMPGTTSPGRRELP